MNAITMIRTATVLLAIGALGGLTMAAVRFSRNLNPPSWLAMLHGLLAAAGATLLLYAALTVGISRLADVGLALLLIAALVGLVLNLKYHSERVLLPPALTLSHAAIAVVGFVLVLLAAWGHA